MIDTNRRNKEIRCAIYTHKSTTEGLEQEFNSLAAQRESCSSCIASQRHEGWVEIENLYDDGGFTGGNMERPALKRLMDDINAGLIDCVALRKELSLLNESLVNLKRAIDAISIPTVDDAHEAKRLDSLASLTEQQTRDLRRRNDLQEQLAKIQASTPDRKTIRKAIKNLEGLWEHLTVGERSRLMSQLVASIDSNHCVPTDLPMWLD